MKIYVASSWRNQWQPGVVKLLRSLGHEVYNFREPEPGVTGFSWSEIDPDWKDWKPEVYRKALDHPVSQDGFYRDMNALRECNACVLVLPCGNSAHLELGWAIGAHKQTCVLFPHGIEATPIGGHSISNERCSACPSLNGCLLPGKLHKIEPELMTKAADAILVNAKELKLWIEALEFYP